MLKNNLKALIAVAVLAVFMVPTLSFAATTNANGNPAVTVNSGKKVTKNKKMVKKSGKKTTNKKTNRKQK